MQTHNGLRVDAQSKAGPLAGIRVLDFSRLLAGAGGTRLLANYGAEVLRVEWPEYPALDFLRLGHQADGIPGMNRGGLFNSINVDKLSITLNMKKPEAVDLAKRIIAVSDVVVENYPPRVMKSFGLDYATVRRVRPDIIYLSQSGWGKDGPRADYRSYGMSSAAHAGVAFLCGLPDHPPAGWQFAYCDHIPAWLNTITIMMALRYRQRTGRGVFIDQAQTQAAVTLVGPSFLDFSVNGRKSRRPGFPPGNRRLYPPVAPHGAFPCLGKDTWCAITVFTEDEWTGLKEAMGKPLWAEDPKFATAQDRAQHQDELEGHLAGWTKGVERYELARLLQVHGVPAGVVQTARDRVDWDTQLQHRGTFQVYSHPEVGPRRYETVAAWLSNTPYTPKRAAPLLGQDNGYTLTEVLGCSEAQLHEWERQDVIRTHRGERTEAHA